MKSQKLSWQPSAHPAAVGGGKGSQDGVRPSRSREVGGQRVARPPSVHACKRRQSLTFAQLVPGAGPFLHGVGLRHKNLRIGRIWGLRGLYGWSGSGCKAGRGETAA
jgi:hypothetical protein